MTTRPLSMIVLLAVFLLSANASAMYDGKQDASDIEYDVGGLIVAFKPDVRLDINKNVMGDISTGLPAMDRLNAKWGVTRMDRIVKSNHNLPDHPFARYYVIESRGDPGYRQMKSEYEQLHSVERVELDYIMKFAAEPNDPLFDYQFNLYNTGQVHPVVIRLDGDFNDYVDWQSGLPGADINAYETLCTPPDNTSAIIVGLIDSGVDLDHPDLEDHIWTNSYEIAGNGLDDDHNGYIDDVTGWDFNGDESDNDPTDELGHGSHCAGIITGVTNNNTGIAGVCPDVQLMPLRTSLQTSDNIAAMIYATDNGADVISMSWGGYSLVFTTTMEEALTYARSKGVTLLAASGNLGVEVDHFPSYHPTTISVGASTDEDEVADFTAYNIRQDIVAPGVDILSLRADNLDPYGTDGGSSGIEPGVHVIEDYYYLMTGTSMACPTAAGVAAYLMAVSPGLTPDKCKDLLTQTAHDIVDPYGIGMNLPGWDKYSGWGRVDLGAALAATPDLIVQITSPGTTRCWPGQRSISPALHAETTSHRSPWSMAKVGTHRNGQRLLLLPRL